jgi:hypothetical protein
VSSSQLAEARDRVRSFGGYNSDQPRGLYVVHLTAIDLARGLRSDLLIFNMAALGITVLLGAALYFIIERPALRLRHRLPPNAAGPLPIIASVGAVSVGLAIIVWRAFNS